MSQRIYAKLKKNSKCAYQTAPGQIFEVIIDPHKNPAEYVVHGNGDQYRLCDVNLFVHGDDGIVMRIPNGIAKK